MWFVFVVCALGSSVPPVCSTHLASRSLSVVQTPHLSKTSTQPATSKNNARPRNASVGTALEVQAHTFEPDGRILVVNKGLRRFRVTRVVKERPVLICEVEDLPEDGDEGPEVRG